jgi:acetyl esterase
VPFCGLLEVSNPERFGARRALPRWIDRLVRDISGLYLRGVTAPPGAPERDLVDPLVFFERAAAHGGRPDRAPPAFFVPVGTRDPVIDDTRRLAAALAAQEVPCTAAFYPGQMHAFHALMWRAEARRCWADVLGFLAAQLAPAALSGTSDATAAVAP